MTVNVQIYKGQLPTEEQRMGIREAAIDKKAKAAVTLELSKENMDKAYFFEKSIESY